MYVGSLLSGLCGVNIYGVLCPYARREYSTVLSTHGVGIHISKGIRNIHHVDRQGTDKGQTDATRAASWVGRYILTYLS